MKELRTLPDGSITYELHRKRVKNMNLRVTTSGVVRVSASPRVPLGMIEEFICRHRAFIEKALQNRKSRGGHPMVPALDTEIMVMGQMYRVMLEKPHTVSAYLEASSQDSPRNSLLNGNLLEDKPLQVCSSKGGISRGRPSQGKTSTYAVAVADDILLVRYPSDPNVLDASKVERMWLNFWKAIGQDFMETLAQQVHKEFKEAGYTVPSPTLRLRYMTSRWGSCMPVKEVITMNTRLLLGPTKFAHYVMVHEFAHFIEANHSSRFYKVMSDVLPNWQQVKAEMKAYYT
ncbi:M48 family metallopeptidase [Veillonella sp. CHU740]|uniref:M48 family metallopeptidase n=1 Tax=Veillonella sp. CHU740 TaxID=2490950 RepID=UPI000F8E6396|nr:YgjP-like metallopeptidase domain-containing protein [Veillonella sp. CHU740]